MPANARLCAAITATVLLWGWAFVGIRSALPALGYGNLVVGRFALAALMFALLARRLGVQRPSRRQLPLLAVLGATGYAGYQLLLSAGERTVPAGTSALIFSFAPVLALVLARPVLGERVSRRTWIGLAVAICGIALSEGATATAPLGGALILGGVTLYALWIVLQKRALRSLKPVTVTAWGTWFGALWALPFGTGLPGAVASAPAGALLTLLALGAIVTTVPFLLWTWTLSQLDAGRAAPIMLLIAPATLLIGFVWLGEVPSVAAVAGGALTLAAVASSTIRGFAMPRRGAAPLPRTPGLRLAPAATARSSRHPPAASGRPATTRGRRGGLRR
jgi:drug/metabolite transporter (DMT)-like permease